MLQLQHKTSGVQPFLSRHNSVHHVCSVLSLASVSTTPDLISGFRSVQIRHSFLYVYTITKGESIDQSIACSVSSDTCQGFKVLTAHTIYRITTTPDILVSARNFNNDMPYEERACTVRNMIICAEQLFQTRSYSGDPHPLLAKIGRPIRY
jgi:hypothetical protein